MIFNLPARVLSLLKIWAGRQFGQQQQWKPNINLFGETGGIHAALAKNVNKTILTTRMGFEPTRAEHIGLAVQRLNHSATSSVGDAHMS